MKLFYDHLLIDLNSVYAEIEHLEINFQQKRRLAKIVDETSHHTVLDVILEHLPKADHENFLEGFHSSPHDAKHWEFLKQRVKNIDIKISYAINELSAQLLAAISVAVGVDKLNKSKP